jgi:hypothetical protein
MIAFNTIANNTSIGFPYWAKLGGGIFADGGSSPLVLNNVITGNVSTDYGGGIACNLSSNPRVINNTIIRNTANDGGGIVSWNNSAPAIENCILWNNSAPTNPEISECCGSVATVNYSDIQGGWGGIGNIDIDPLFSDTAAYYLSDVSPCVDSGNPDSTFDDPEDPENPGFALRPAMGTLRNDMGAYGGPGAAGELTTSVKESGIDHMSPSRFTLHQNYPNPFNPTTTIKYDLPIGSHVNLKLFDILGREVLTLVNGVEIAGHHQVTLNAAHLSSGVYFYKITAGSFTDVEKLVVVK